MVVEAGNVMLKLNSGRGKSMDETGRTRKSICEIIKTLCEHALTHEYSSNPVGNLVLRLWRDRILDYACSGYDSLEDYLAALPGSLIPEVVEVCKNTIDLKLLHHWYKELGRQESMSNRITTDYLYEKIEERAVEFLIACEEAPALNDQPI